MAWVAVEEAVASGALGSRATVFRRLSGGELADRTDEQGVRLVWIAPSENERLARLESAVEDLVALVRELASRLGPPPGFARVIPAEGPFQAALNGSADRPEALAHEAPASAELAQGEAPVAVVRPAAWRTAIANEGEVLELLGRVDRLGLPDRELERRAGIATGFLSKARHGAKRGRGAASSWTRLRAAVASAEGARRESA